MITEENVNKPETKVVQERLVLPPPPEVELKTIPIAGKDTEAILESLGLEKAEVEVNPKKLYGKEVGYDLEDLSPFAVLDYLPDPALLEKRGNFKLAERGIVRDENGLYYIYEERHIYDGNIKIIIVFEAGFPINNDFLDYIREIRDKLENKDDDLKKFLRTNYNNPDVSEEIEKFINSGYFTTTIVEDYTKIRNLIIIGGDNESVAIDLVANFLPQGWEIRYYPHLRTRRSQRFENFGQEYGKKIIHCGEIYDLLHLAALLHEFGHNFFSSLQPQNELSELEELRKRFKSGESLSKDEKEKLLKNMRLHERNASAYALRVLRRLKDIGIGIRTENMEKIRDFITKALESHEKVYGVNFTRKKQMDDNLLK